MRSHKQVLAPSLTGTVIVLTIGKPITVIIHAIITVSLSTSWITIAIKVITIGKPITVIIHQIVTNFVGTGRIVITVKIFTVCKSVAIIVYAVITDLNAGVVIIIVTGLIGNQTEKGYKKNKDKLFHNTIDLVRKWVYFN
jgi:uncharacterized membrane protein